jgi:hypothetical protein
MPIHDLHIEDPSDKKDENLKKKPSYSVGKELHEYLKEYLREQKQPLHYEDLLRYDMSFPLLDGDGNDTLWMIVSYLPSDKDEIYKGLLQIYVMLASDGNMEQLKHLSVDRVDYCLFGNSNPFRIKIKNTVNDNYDYYYIKKADASRIYGLELEHIVSPNKINYFVYKDTLVEEHIMGIPGDSFLKNNLLDTQHNKVRLAKEFVKFNERCFLRLLGDMRSYNFVIDMTPDFDQIQYRIRTIDFDQQSYEGKYRFYFPQFFTENILYVELALKYLSTESIRQYQAEERALMAKRISLSLYQYKKLLKVMENDSITQPEKGLQLANELAKFHRNDVFLKCKTMGCLVRENLNLMLNMNIKV